MALLLSRSDVASVLRMPEAIEAVERALIQLARGQASMPPRALVRIDHARATHLSMPALVGGEQGGLAVKLVTTFPDNPARHRLPTVLGLVVLHDVDTGAALAVMDASLLTAIRTGAASGVATRWLANPGASRVGVIGAGVQAERQLEAVGVVRPVRSARVYDPDADRAARFAARMEAELAVATRPVSSARAAVEGSDIVIVATTSGSPVLEGRWLEPGQHVNAIGAHTPATREVDTEAILRSRVFADQREACLNEAGEILVPIGEGVVGPEHVLGSIGEVATGAVAGRTDRNDITLFKSVGLAVEDVAASRLVYDRAREAGLGRELDFGA